MQVRSESSVSELETYLVIPLTSRTVSESISSDLTSEVDVCLTDQWTSDRSTEEVLAFVNRVGTHHWVDVVSREVIYEVELKRGISYQGLVQRLNQSVSPQAINVLVGEGNVNV